MLSLPLSLPTSLPLSGMIGDALSTGGGVPAPPEGFLFLIDPDGAYLIDADGYYLVEAA